MNDQIRVHVVKYSGRINLMMRYRCPLTGKQIGKSSGTPRRKEAEKAAAKWEADLQTGRYSKDNRMSWQEFVDLFIEQHLSELAPKSRDNYVVSLNAYVKVCRPQRLADVTTVRVAHFKSELRKGGRKPATVASYLRHLKAALRWAHSQGYLSTVPDCKPPKGSTTATTMKGRPVTGEEFDRMLDAVAKVVRAEKVEAWKFYLRALWFSGLRLSESLTLTWDENPDAISVDLRGRRPMLRIPAAVEKGKRNRVLPITPDFAELLATVPEARRRGRVFSIDGRPDKVSPVVTDIGEAAGVRVTAKKFASAHDLRRSFGTRWSRSLSPARLKALMRHADISTTMRFYVDEDAEELADALFEVTARVTPPQNDAPETTEAAAAKSDAATA
jgi:integrase